MHISPKERARIFAIYAYIAKVRLMPISGTGGWLDYQDLHEIAKGTYNESRLLLKPLSSISDTHAISIAKMFRADCKWKVNKRLADHIILECKDWSMYIWFTDCTFIDFEEKYTGAEVIKAHGCERETSSADNEIIDMIDQLRGWGYALPYKGYSLFQLGLAEAI